MKRTRGNISLRREGVWQLKFDAPSADGSRSTRYATVYGTATDAKRELTRLLSKADDNTLPEPSTATVAGYVTAWLDGATGQSGTTLERYRQLAANQIVPGLGHHRLQKLRAEHVRSWHKTLLGKVSARTVGHAHRLLRLVLADAIKAGALTVNVCDTFRPPRVETDEIEILDKGQVEAVRAALGGSSLAPIVELALATGMRRGEILGLQWQDVDLDAGTLRVERSVEETSSGGIRTKSPKTKRGRRNVSLHPEVVVMLRAHKVKVMELRVAVGMGKLENTTHVFTNTEGGLLRPRNVTKACSRLVAAHKLPDVSFHALRSTHASTLIAAGIDILTISRRLGHSKAAITLDV